MSDKNGRAGGDSGGRQWKRKGGKPFLQLDRVGRVVVRAAGDRATGSRAPLPAAPHTVVNTPDQALFS